MTEEPSADDGGRPGEGEARTPKSAPDAEPDEAGPEEAGPEVPEPTDERAADTEVKGRDDAADSAGPVEANDTGQSAAAPGEHPGKASPGWLRRVGRRKILSGALALALAVGVGTTLAYQTNSWPFQDDYCWGALSEGAGPLLLSDDALEGGHERTGTATAAPSPERPRGKCGIRLTEEEAGVSIVDVAEVRYGPVPKSTQERGSWLADHMSASTAPLPDGLPGVVGNGGGMVVLPKSCDVDGRPSVVTVNGKSTGEYGPSLFRTDREALDVLLAVANKGMATADCAPEQPYEASSPITGADQDPTWKFSSSFRACRIPGMRFDLSDVGAKMLDFETRASVQGKRRQMCWLELEDPSSWPNGKGQYLMVTEPRLVALFTGMTGGEPPANGWRGSGRLTDARQVVRADCSGEPTVFYGWLGEDLRGAAQPGPKQIFARFTEAVAKRVDCAPVTP